MMISNRIIHRIIVCPLIILISTTISCNTTAPDKSTGELSSADTFQLIETIVDSTRGELVVLSGFKRNDQFSNMLQHWELKDVDDASTNKLMFENGNGERIYQDIVLFPDSVVVYNFRNELQIGKWHIARNGSNSNLILQFTGLPTKQYQVSSITSKTMRLHWEQNGDSLSMLMRADGLAHAEMTNDPLHPTNLKWMIRPHNAESDQELHQRVKGCVKFYALYFRDVIIRKAAVINFAGLPSIFLWYNGGIGLPERDKLEDSWVKCFYNKEQALQAYDILSNLLLQYEFAWPKKTPNWFYKTHSVLEQMYHKL